jgi:hypothetical protein
MRIAESRADVDAITEVLEGEYLPSRTEYFVQWLVFLGFVGIVVSVAWEQPGSVWTVGSIAILLLVIGWGLWTGVPAYAVTRQEFVRQTWLAASSWRVPVADVHAIDLDFNGDAISLTLVLNDDRKRKLELRKEGKQRLARLYPFLSDEEPDYAAISPDDRDALVRFHTRLLRIFIAVMVVSVGVIAADLATKDSRSLPDLAEDAVDIAGSLAAAGIMIGGIGIAEQWFARRKVRLAKIPGRSVLYAVLAVVVIATAVMLWVFASKGLITWD